MGRRSSSPKSCQCKLLPNRHEIAYEFPINRRLNWSFVYKRGLLGFQRHPVHILIERKNEVIFVSIRLYAHFLTVISHQIPRKCLRCTFWQTADCVLQGSSMDIPHPCGHGFDFGKTMNIYFENLFWFRGMWDDSSSTDHNLDDSSNQRIVYKFKFKDL